MSTKQQYIELIKLLKNAFERKINIKYAKAGTVFVTQEFLKTRFYSQMKDMSRDSLTRQ